MDGVWVAERIVMHEGHSDIWIFKSEDEANEKIKYIKSLDDKIVFSKISYDINYIPFGDNIMDY